MSQEQSTTALAAELELPVVARPRLAAARLAGYAVRRPVTTLSILILVTMGVVAAFAPWIAPYDPTALNAADRLLSPSRQHFFGTDSVGHDVFSQIVFGARVSLLVGFGATLLGTFLGSIIGLISGYFTGPTDALIQRIMDGIQSIPALILLMVVAGVWQRGMLTVVVALAVLIAPLAGRVIRGAVLSVRENQYVEAARAMGATPLRVMSVHIFPNVVPLIIVICSITLGSAILVEGALSFVGLGIQADDPMWKTSWGTMLRPQNLQYMEQAPLLAVFPGAAIGLAVLAFNMLGDALRDALDPRLRGASQGAGPLIAPAPTKGPTEAVAEGT